MHAISLAAYMSHEAQRCFIVCGLAGGTCQPAGIGLKRFIVNTTSVPCYLSSLYTTFPVYAHGMSLIRLIYKAEGCRVRVGR